MSGDPESAPPPAAPAGLALWRQVWKAEGTRAVLDRAWDRWLEARRTRAFRRVDTAPPGFRAAVLILAAAPPAPRLGGVQAQLLWRLEAESALHPTALLYPLSPLAPPAALPFVGAPTTAPTHAGEPRQTASLEAPSPPTATTAHAGQLRRPGPPDATAAPMDAESHAGVRRQDASPDAGAPATATAHAGQLLHAALPDGFAAPAALPARATEPGQTASPGVPGAPTAFRLELAHGDLRCVLEWHPPARLPQAPAIGLEPTDPSGPARPAGGHLAAAEASIQAGANLPNRTAAGAAERGTAESAGSGQAPDEVAAAVAWAMAQSGAAALQVEGLAGLPLPALLALADRGLLLILALHDFAAFCPRPHLWEHPPPPAPRRFCDYSRDAGRCARCLAATWPALPPGFQEHRRHEASRLLAASTTVVYPSAFLAAAHAALFASPDPALRPASRPDNAAAAVPNPAAFGPDATNPATAGPAATISATAGPAATNPATAGPVASNPSMVNPAGDLPGTAASASVDLAAASPAQAADRPAGPVAASRIIAPAPPPAPRRLPAHREASGPPRHIAWVGAVHEHKGALVFESALRHLAATGHRPRLSAFGGGDRAILARWRRLPGLRVRGYYRAGSLAALLRRHRVDVALLLSVVPESYGLTLDECAAARVPAIAFRLGALTERLPASAGILLDPPFAAPDDRPDPIAPGAPASGPIAPGPLAPFSLDPGALDPGPHSPDPAAAAVTDPAGSDAAGRALARLLADILEGKVPLPRPVAPPPRHPEVTAAAWLDLYRSLDLRPG